MEKGVRTTAINNSDDIRSFFDGIADEYSNQHGKPGTSFNKRINLIKREIKLSGNEHIAEICCGPGFYLISLEKYFKTGIGIDFSSEMIRVANSKIRRTETEQKLIFKVDDATQLKTIENSSLDAAFCIGSLEHIPDQKSVIYAVKRVLKPGGKFVCLTLNGDYIWYKTLASLIGFKTQYLSTDHFLSKVEIERLIIRTGLKTLRIGYWSFVPKSDMPKFLRWLFQLLDAAGRMLYIPFLRGGIYFTLET
jgi:ubiquinone/menaquinone biosynthesis C-methylase UbiE